MTEERGPGEPQSRDPTDVQAGRAGPEPRRTTTIEDIRAIYADQVDRMARFDWCNRLLTGRFRRRLFGRGTGRVLDVACGTGLNRLYLPDEVEYVGVDVSPEMLRKAADRLADAGLEGTLLEMDAQALGFPADSFDTVLSSLSTCTFPDPVVALREMRRVCRPDGRILLLEHGRSTVEAIARLQDWRADAHFEKHACRLNQQPLENVERAGLSVRDVTTGMLGMVTAVEAAPG